MSDPATRDDRGRGRPHVLVVAYYFPPLGLSGVQRVAKWCRYLPSAGWDVTVLTVEPGAYFAFDDTLLEEVESAGVRIIRTRTLDPTRQGGGRKVVSFPSERRRRLFSWLSGFFFLPDNKRGWTRQALSAWKDICRDGRPDIVFSSAPPYTSFLVGQALARKAGVPHVMDYRDDWLDNPRHDYPTPIHRRIHARMERRLLSSAALVTTINASIRERLLQRSPGSDVRILPQGFDPADITQGEDQGGVRRAHRRSLLVYAGMFYHAQQPDTFLKAVSLVKSRLPESSPGLEARFVGLFPDDKKPLIASLGLEDDVTLTGYKNHHETVGELMEADVLWMTVGRQPGEEMISTGKLFEYMGTGKPILALVPPGEASKALEGYGAAWVCDPDDVEGVASTLEAILKQLDDGTLPVGSPEWIAPFDRKKQAEQLAGWFSGILDEDTNG